MFVNTASCDMLKVDYMPTNQLAALASKGLGRIKTAHTIINKIL